MGVRVSLWLAALLLLHVGMREREREKSGVCPKNMNCVSIIKELGHRNC